MNRGHLIAFEGLDQSGKQTQAERLVAAPRGTGGPCTFLSFPDYDTAIGGEIGRALHGDRDYAPDVMQLLYVANRYEFRPVIASGAGAGRRGRLRSLSGLEHRLRRSAGARRRHGSTTMQRHLPAARRSRCSWTSRPRRRLQRKQRARDRYERDLALLARVRDSYRRQSADATWVSIDGARDKDAVTEAVFSAVRSRLGLL